MLTRPDGLTAGYASGRLLVMLVLLQLAIYGVIAWLSPQFDFYAIEHDRPLLLVLSLFLINFALHLSSLAILLRFPDSRRMGWRITLLALAMRMILIGSTPIQEVDIYRYIWDGIVMKQGISPFRYPPLAIADSEEPTSNSQLVRLRAVVARDNGIRETLHRVHFPQITTVYPSVSQFVFAAAAFITPENSSVSIRVLIMKCWIVAFDIASLGLIWMLLHQFGKHTAWLITWGWSPLVLKEFANSGHLDSIAVFFTLAATCVLVINPTRTRMWAIGSLMAFAVASKLFPMVLLPVWIGTYAKHAGWIHGLQLGAVTILACFVLLLPMVWDLPISQQNGDVTTVATDQGSLHGLSTFLTRWEMNDLLFMVIQENVRPAIQAPNHPPLWFVVVPESWRHAATSQLVTWSGQREDQLPFLIARTITAAIFVAVLLWLTLRSAREPHQMPQCVFLTLAWFWFLSPTQNPWYWCWALAFVPFANSRIWLAVSGLGFIYYLRFWFLYHSADAEVFGTSFSGTDFFDFLVVWLEFGPFLFVLGIKMLWNSCSDAKHVKAGLKCC